MGKVSKRIIALVVAVALILGTFAGINIHKKNEQKRIENSFYEVNFDITDNAAKEGPERITLPDTQMVKNGTIVGGLPQPEKEGAVFMGWYYDKKSEKMALSNDAITENITLYADFENGTNIENRFKINYMSSQEVEDDFSVEIEILDGDISEIKEYLKVSDISEGGVEVGFLLKEAEGSSNRAVLYPETIWKHGDLFQVEILSTGKARYVRDGELSSEDVVYYNFTVKREEINSLKVNNDVVYIDVRETEGVDIKEGLYNLVSGLNGDSEEKKEERGVMKYAGDLPVDSTVAVYDGTLNDDKTVDGEVFYIHITGKNSDGSYNYESVEFADVIFVPDVIPIPFEGNFEDGMVTVDRSLISFDKEVYKQFNLSKDTKVEPGDYIALFNGSLEAFNSAKLVGYGLVTKIEEAGNNVAISYTEASKEDIIDSFQMYSIDNNVEVPLSAEEIASLEREFEEEARANKFDEEAMDYVEQLICSDELDEEQFSQAISRLTFEDQTGKNFSLEDIRLLADDEDSFYEIPNAPTIKAVVSPKLDHFEGKTGIRVEVSASFSIKIKLNSTAKGQNELEIKVVAALEQEVTLGVSVSVDADWDWIVIVPVLRGVDVKVSFTAGTYTGIGASLAVTTSVDDDESEWKKLVEANNKVNNSSGEKKDSKSMKNTLSAMKDTFKKVQNGVGGSKEGKKDLEEVQDKKEDQFESNGGIGGDLPDKYSGMLSNDAEYIDIVNKEIFKIAASPDPFHIIEFSLGVNFVVGMKVNCMMGWGISYANAKEYCFMIHINVFGDKASSCTSSNADLETPNFRADFYVFGNVGARAGIRLDARVGVLSTTLNSVGIIAEAGIYWEIYGFLYVYYSWESGEGSDMGAMGSMLFEIGVYLKIDFCARLIGKNLNKTIKIYDHKWPLLDLGATEVPIEFEDVDKSHLDLEFPMAGEENKENDAAGSNPNSTNAQVALSNKLAVPSDVFKVKLMSLKSGEVSSKNMDSDENGSEAYSFVQNGLNCVQYNEKNFNIRCVDLTEKDGEAAGTHQIRYLPASNEIYVKPNVGVSELWGQIIITYKDNTFGFNTNSISRTIDVHWKGVAATAEVQYYIRDEAGNDELYKIGDFSGFDGIVYDIVFDEEFFNQIPGCTLIDVGFDDEDKLEETYHIYADTFADLEKTFNNEHKLVGENTYTVSREALETARSKSAAAKKAYFDFQSDRKKVMKEKKGTLSFLMCSENTVVRLYFKKVFKNATFILNPYVALTDGDGRDYYNSDYDSTVTVLKDSNIADAMPSYCKDYPASHSNHKINWYYYEYDMDKIRRPLGPQDILDNENKWIEFTDDLKMPEADVVVFGFEEHWREYELTWYDGNDEVAGTMILIAKADLIPTDLEIPLETYEGKEIVGWRMEDGKLINEKTLMPEKNVFLFPEFENKKYVMNISWEGPDHPAVDTREVAFESSIEEALSWYSENWCTDEVMEGRTFEWLMEGDSEGEFIPIDGTLKMPARDINVVGRFENNEYKLTIDDGSQTVTETHKYEEQISLPEKKDSEGYELGWILDDGTVVKESFLMPCKDTTVKPNFHTHEWKLVSEREANCTEEGVKEYACGICGAKKRVTSPVNPSHHVFAGASYVSSRANCVHGTKSVYLCQNCDYQEVRDDGKVASDNHDTEVRGEKAATCKDEGYSGDVYCRNCGDLVSQGHVIPKTENHNFVFSQTLTEATLSAEGLEEIECTICHKKDTRVVPKLTGVAYTVIFRNDLTSDTDTRTYVSGTAGTLPEDLGGDSNHILSRWLGVSSSFNPGATLVWDESAAGPENPELIYLPALDPDGDRVIELNAYHALKCYWFDAMNSTGTESYEVVSNRLVEATREAVEYSRFISDVSYYLGAEGITGWSLTPGGTPIDSLPAASQYAYGANVILYALTN